MNSVSWRKRISVLLSRLYLYPEPEPMPHNRRFWIAMGLVTLAAALFSAFYIAYMTGLQSAYLTHAEDLGIMDQAVWNTVHGDILHQTICNILTDTNCYSPNGIMRFAIHVEPLLFPISLLYLIWPSPNTLVTLQAVVVATGAYPAFWLARLRLRNEWAAVVIALLYLLYPALQNAVYFDFHAVTLTAAFIMFVFYFMYTRRTVWLFVFAVLAMACKEEIPGVLAIFGLWSMVFQRRWRSGLALTLLGLAWTGAVLLLEHIFSPVGQSLLTGRYTYLGHGPLQIGLNLLLHPVRDLKDFVLQPQHELYLRIILAPTGFLAILAPWIWILAVPTLALNLLSSDPQMYSGLFQYNAEIVPIFIFATIEALVLLLWLVQLVLTKIRQQSRAGAATAIGSEILTTRPPALLRKQRGWTFASVAHVTLLTLFSAYLLINVVRIDTLRGHLPFSEGFQWPQVTAHDLLAQKFEALIPANASVAAQSSLVPHISHRRAIYMFPYGTGLYKESYQAQYVFLDVTSDIYPYLDTSSYVHDVKTLLTNGTYGVVAAQDGYLLLKRGLPAPGMASYSEAEGQTTNPTFLSPNLPEKFCSYTQVSQQDVRHNMQVNFTTATGANVGATLIGFRMNAPTVFSKSAGYVTVETYWKVNAPTAMLLQPVVLMIASNGQPYVVSTDFPAALWCETTGWKPGTIVDLETRVFGLQSIDIPTGLAHLAISLAPMIESSDTMSYVRQSLSAQVVKGLAQAVTIQHIHTVEVMPLTITP